MKAKCLKRGDKVAIVSLSSGVLGEDFIKHELDLGIKRLQELELEPIVMPNATKGIKFLAEHPEARAKDLMDAFLDPSIKAIICAIGGNDTYKLIPHLFTQSFIDAVKQNPKIFMGFSDTTINHLTLNSLGLNTFYGPAFLTDFAELNTDMLSYTKYWVLNMFINRPSTMLESSSVWYKDRTDFSPKALGTPREMLLEEQGFVSLCKKGQAKGKLYGGCLESIYSVFVPETSEQKKIFEKYNIWNMPQNAILFLETSELKIEPEKFRTILQTLKQKGIFDKASGVLFGKPIDQVFMAEYMQIIKEELPESKVLYNLNFGHAYPRCIVPYGIEATVDFDACTVEYTEPMFEPKDLLEKYVN